MKKIVLLLVLSISITLQAQNNGVISGYVKDKGDICGHIHNFQHIRKQGSDIDYVVNSSGSLSRNVKPIDGTQFCNSETGFSLLSADKHELTLFMLNKEKEVLHKVVRRK